MNNQQFVDLQQQSFQKMGSNNSIHVSRSQSQELNSKPRNQQYYTPDKVPTQCRVQYQQQSQQQQRVSLQQQQQQQLNNFFSCKPQADLYTSFSMNQTIQPNQNHSFFQETSDAATVNQLNQSFNCMNDYQRQCQRHSISVKNRPAVSGSINFNNSYSSLVTDCQIPITLLKTPQKKQNNYIITTNNIGIPYSQQQQQIYPYQSMGPAIMLPPKSKPNRESIQSTISDKKNGLYQSNHRPGSRSFFIEQNYQIVNDNHNRSDLINDSFQNVKSVQTFQGNNNSFQINESGIFNQQQSKAYETSNSTKTDLGININPNQQVKNLNQVVVDYHKPSILVKHSKQTHNTQNTFVQNNNNNNQQQQSKLPPQLEKANILNITEKPIQPQQQQQQLQEDQKSNNNYHYNEIKDIQMNTVTVASKKRTDLIINSNQIPTIQEISCEETSKSHISINSNFLLDKQPTPSNNEQQQKDQNQQKKQVEKQISFKNLDMNLQFQKDLTQINRQEQQNTLSQIEDGTFQKKNEVANQQQADSLNNDEKKENIIEKCKQIINNNDQPIKDLYSINQNNGQQQDNRTSQIVQDIKDDSNCNRETNQINLQQNECQQFNSNNQQHLQQQNKQGSNNQSRINQMFDKINQAMKKNQQMMESLQNSTLQNANPQQSIQAYLKQNSELQNTQKVTLDQSQQFINQQDKSQEAISIDSTKQQQMTSQYQKNSINKDSNDQDNSVNHILKDLVHISQGDNGIQNNQNEQLLNLSKKNLKKEDENGQIISKPSFMTCSLSNSDFVDTETENNKLKLNQQNISINKDQQKLIQQKNNLQQQQQDFTNNNNQTNFNRNQQKSNKFNNTSSSERDEKIYNIIQEEFQQISPNVIIGQDSSSKNSANVIEDNNQNLNLKSSEQRFLTQESPINVHQSSNSKKILEKLVSNYFNTIETLKVSEDENIYFRYDKASGQLVPFKLDSQLLNTSKQSLESHLSKVNRDNDNQIQKKYTRQQFDKDPISALCDSNLSSQDLVSQQEKETQMQKSIITLHKFFNQNKMIFNGQDTIETNQKLPYQQLYQNRQDESKSLQYIMNMELQKIKQQKKDNSEIKKGDTYELAKKIVNQKLKELGNIDDLDQECLELINMLNIRKNVNQNNLSGSKNQSLYSTKYKQRQQLITPNKKCNDQFENNCHNQSKTSNKKTYQNKHMLCHMNQEENQNGMANNTHIYREVLHKFQNKIKQPDLAAQKQRKLLNNVNQ